MALNICIAIPGFPEASPPDDALVACFTLASQCADNGHQATLVLSAHAPSNGPASAIPKLCISPKVRTIKLEPLIDTQVIAGWFRRRSYELFRWLQSQGIPFDCVVAPAWQGIAYYASLARRQGIGFANTRFIAYVTAPTQWRLSIAHRHARKYRCP